MLEMREQTPCDDLRTQALVHAGSEARHYAETLPR